MDDVESGGGVDFAEAGCPGTGSFQATSWRARRASARAPGLQRLAKSLSDLAIDDQFDVHPSFSRSHHMEPTTYVSRGAFLCVIAIKGILGQGGVGRDSVLKSGRLRHCSPCWRYRLGLEGMCDSYHEGGIANMGDNIR